MTIPVITIGEEMDSYCDGECQGNGMPNAKCWGSFKIGDYPIVRVSHPGCHTNNESEYATLIAMLEHAKQNNLSGLLVHCDSQLVIGQVSMGWKIKKEHLRPYVLRSRRLVSETSSQLVWVPREEIVKVLGH